MSMPEPTDRQLRAAVYRVARTYLEVERGLRPAEHLDRFLTPTEYRRHRTRPIDPRNRPSGVVLPSELGRIHLDRHLPGQITATLPTRETEQQWGALVLHFARTHTGRWRIDQLQRLERPSVAREPARTPTIDPTVALDQQIGRVADERALVVAAHQAVTTRIAELRTTPDIDDTDRKAARRILRHQQRTWKQRRTELGHELRQLRETRRLRAELTRTEPPALPATTRSTELTAERLTELLGEVPDDPWRARLRDAVIDEIHTYRARWHITDTRTLLGPEPDDPAHRHDRTELADPLRASARALGTRPRPAAPERTRERPGQGPGLADS